MRALCVAGLALALAAVGMGWADVAPGDLRSIQSKAGTALRRDPAPLSPVVATLPYGARAQVEEVRGGYARVVTTAGNGWVRAADLVEPAALTGGGALGPRPGGAGARTAGVTSAEVSAAGRQFDEATEGTYRRENPNLEAHFGAVNAIEQRKPTAAEVETFIRQGRLGR
jgi:hypothetical protein